MTYEQVRYRSPFSSNQGYFPQELGQLEYLLAKSESKADFVPKYHKEYALSSDLYEKQAYSSPRVHKAYHFPVDVFLNPDRKHKKAVHDHELILPLVEAAFLSTTNKKMPQNISITICPPTQLRQIHSQFGQWNEGIQGFVIPGKMHRIFVRSGPLDEVLLIIGHEIGHINSKQLPNLHDEEAKAFSFSIEWANKIRQNDIGNLKESIREEFECNPARNGLHDLAFFFVKHLLKKNQSPMEIHTNLSRGYLSFFGLYF